MLVVGDETGLIKVICGSSSPLVFGEQSRSLGIKSVCACPDSAEKFNVLRQNGSVESWRIDTGEEGDGVLSLRLSSSLPDTLGAPLSLLNLSSESERSTRSIAVSESGQILTLSGEDALSILHRFSVPSPLSAAAATRNSVLIGGNENDAQLYSLDTQQLSWKAKNVLNDKLNLRVPVWITTMDVLPEDGKFITGTAYKHVRLYDTKSGERPTQSFDIDTAYAITSVKVSGSKQTFFVADGGGNLYEHCMSTGRRVHTLKGCTGAIRSMTLCEGGQSLSCVGLDRHLRVYDTSSGKLRSKVYLKNRLNTVAEVGSVRDGGFGGQTESEDDEHGDSDDGESSHSDNSGFAPDRISSLVDSDDESEERKPSVKKRKTGR